MQWHRVAMVLFSGGLISLLIIVRYSRRYYVRQRMEKERALKIATALANEIKDYLVAINNNRRETTCFRPGVEIFRSRWVRMVITIGVFADDEEVSIIYHSAWSASNKFFEKNANVRKLLLRIEMKQVHGKDGLETI